MAVAFDASSTNFGVASTSVSWTHTPVGTPTGIGIASSGWGAGSVTTTSVTYGGQACTVKATSAYDASGGYSDLWYIGNPPSGAQTVVMNFSAGHYPNCVAISVTGGDTTTVFSSSNTATGGGSPVTVTVTSAVAEVVMDCASVIAATSMNAGAGQTDVSNQAIGGEQCAASYEAGAASVVMSWTHLGGNWSTAAGSFKAPASDPIILPQAQQVNIARKVSMIVY